MATSLANPVLLAAVAAGLLWLICWGYRMWWQRRPTRDGRRSLMGRAPAVAPGVRYNQDG